MLELDVFLIPFFDEHFPSLEFQQQFDFTRLLELADPDIFNWLMGNGSPDDESLHEIIGIIREKHYKLDIDSIKVPKTDGQ